MKTINTRTSSGLIVSFLRNHKVESVRIKTADNGYVGERWNGMEYDAIKGHYTTEKQAIATILELFPEL